MRLPPTAPSPACWASAWEGSACNRGRGTPRAGRSPSAPRRTSGRRGEAGRAKGSPWGGGTRGAGWRCPWRRRRESSGGGSATTDPASFDCTARCRLRAGPGRSPFYSQSSRRRSAHPGLELARSLSALPDPASRSFGPWRLELTRRLGRENRLSWKRQRAAWDAPPSAKREVGEGEAAAVPAVFLAFRWLGAKVGSGVGGIVSDPGGKFGRSRGGAVLQAWVWDLGKGVVFYFSFPADFRRYFMHAKGK